MAKAYRVFLGAPTVRESRNEGHAYQWQTVSSITRPLITLPPATFEAASRRISALYENIIFREDNVEEHMYASILDAADVTTSQNYRDETTAITWPPTLQESRDTHNVSRSALTSLRPPASMSRIRSHFQTQDSQDTGSYNYSDASSIGKFPTFHFSLHTLTALSAVTAHAQSDMRCPGAPRRRGSKKVSILVAVLEVEGPDTIRVKKGPEAGSEVSLLKLILGDEDGSVCKLTAWREIAETWGGADPDTPVSGIKRGDVVLFENVLASWGGDPDSDTSNAAPVTLTASSNLKSRLEFCYRTMPYVQDDVRFRPDLRLGFSDASVSKVATVVRWFEGMAGLVANS